MDKRTQQPWHSNEKFGTYRFYNVHKGREETTPSQSLKNVAEAQVAVALFQRLRRDFSAVSLDFRVGVVSMYSAQVTELRRVFSQRLEKDVVEKIHFHTVDGFQGQEKDVIILSCVRAGPGLQNVGFLAGADVCRRDLYGGLISLSFFRHSADERRIDSCEVILIHLR
jgi:senataxin